MKSLKEFIGTRKELSINDWLDHEQSWMEYYEIEELEDYLKVTFSGVYMYNNGPVIFIIKGGTYYILYERTDGLFDNLLEAEITFWNEWMKRELSLTEKELHEDMRSQMGLWTDDRGLNSEEPFDEFVYGDQLTEDQKKFAEYLIQLQVSLLEEFPA